MGSRNIPRNERGSHLGLVIQAIKDRGLHQQLHDHICNGLETSATEEGPCPVCGGNTRYRYDHPEAGYGICSHCGGPAANGGQLSNVDVLIHQMGGDAKRAVPELCRVLDIDLQSIRKRCRSKRKAAVQPSLLAAATVARPSANGIKPPAPETPAPAASLPDSLDDILELPPDPPTRYTDGAELVSRYHPHAYVIRQPGKKIRPLIWNARANEWGYVNRILKGKKEIGRHLACVPLYGFDFTLYPEEYIQTRTVIWVEGEKTGAAVRLVVGDTYTITHTAGFSSTKPGDKGTNYSGLFGRDLVIVPDLADKDGTGSKKARQTAQYAMDAGARSVAMVSHEHLTHLAGDGIKPGWDLADKPDLSLEDVTLLVQTAQPWEPEPAKEAKPPKDPFRHYAKDDDGAPVLKTMQALTERFPDLRLNTLSDVIEAGGQPIKSAEQEGLYLELQEAAARKAWRAQQEGLDFDDDFTYRKNEVMDALALLARRNPYDPVKSYLLDLEARQVPILPDSIWLTLATGFWAAPNTMEGSLKVALERGGAPRDHKLRVLLIGAVKRVFQPGCKHDTALIIYGPQGCRKSTFWKVLFGEQFFNDSLEDLSNKDDLIKLHQYWAHEWAELEKITTRKEASHIKAVLSSASDVYRKPYGRVTEPHPRSFVMVGSSNRDDFLVDATGNRRFHVEQVHRSEKEPIDTARLADLRDQIWATALHHYRQGTPNWLPPDLAMESERQNEGHLVEHPWAHYIEQYLDDKSHLTEWPGGDGIRTHQVMDAIGGSIDNPGIPLEQRGKSDEMVVGDILKQMGLTRKLIKRGGKPYRAYVRISES